MYMTRNLILEPFAWVLVLADVPYVVVVAKLSVKLLGERLNLSVGGERHPVEGRCYLNEIIVIVHSEGHGELILHLYGQVLDLGVGFLSEFFHLWCDGLQFRRQLGPESIHFFLYV